MDGEEREFLGKIRKATFANPFGAVRETVDLELTGMARDSSNAAILARLIEEVYARIAPYRRKTRSLPAEDYHLLKYGVLFYLFHVFCEDYDNHIAEQIKKREEPCELECSSRILGHLREFGFSRSESLQYLAFFFQLRRGFYFISKIKGDSPSVSRLRQSLWDNIFTYDASLYEEHLWNRMEDFSTIILGETGTGKGLSAAAIGRSGHIPFDEKRGCFKDSFAATFISINLSQFSEDLIESELFGHKKGAFTGAVDRHSGVFSRCSPYGAIFLDEIGEVSVPLQIKLLQVLQEREFSPVGSHSKLKFHGRVIAATNRSLMERRKQGQFRDDFYYRLCSDLIEVPSLRVRLHENPKEIRVLIEGTLERILGYHSNSLAEELEEMIERSIPSDYPWPGNIRELEQCVRQMLIRRSYRWEQNIESTSTADGLRSAIVQGTISAADLLAGYCAHLYKQYGTIKDVAEKVKLDRRTVRKYILQADGEALK